MKVRFLAILDHCWKVDGMGHLGGQTDDQRNES